MASIFLGLNELIGNKYNSHSSDSYEPGSQLLSHSTLLSQVSLGKWLHDLHYNLVAIVVQFARLFRNIFNWD